MIINLRL